MTPADALRLRGHELEAVVASWRRHGRVLETAFDGTSMLPAIAPGMPVVLDCGREPACGEVAVFTFEGGVGVHRLVLQRGDWLVTWGDANPLPDGPIRRSQLIGTLQSVPSRRRGAWRAALLAVLVPAGAGFEQATRRVARAHRVLRAWRGGPRVFLAACWRKLAARATPSPRPLA